VITPLGLQVMTHFGLPTEHERARQHGAAH
jgi:hypothetical protein